MFAVGDKVLYMDAKNGVHQAHIEGHDGIGAFYVIRLQNKMRAHVPYTSLYPKHSLVKRFKINRVMNKRAKQFRRDMSRAAS